MELKKTPHAITTLLFCSVAMFAIHTQAAEKYYKWIDQQGTTQYTQDPPPANARKVLKSVVVSHHIPMTTPSHSPETATPTTAPNVKTNAAAPATSTPEAPSAASPNQSPSPTNQITDTPPEPAR